MFQNDLIKIYSRYLASGDRKKMFRMLEIVLNQQKPQEDEHGMGVAYGLLEGLLMLRDFEAAEQLVKRVPGVLQFNQFDGGPIHAVMESSGDCPDLVKWLVQHGADIESRGMNNWTPLHRAANGGFVGTLTVLLDHGAEIEAGTVIDGDLTPLLEAVSAGQFLAVMALVFKGADWNCEDGMLGQSAIEIAKNTKDKSIYEFLIALSDKKRK